MMICNFSFTFFDPSQLQHLHNKNKPQSKQMSFVSDRTQWQAHSKSPCKATGRYVMTQVGSMSDSQPKIPQIKSYSTLWETAKCPMRIIPLFCEVTGFPADSPPGWQELQVICHSHLTIAPFSSALVTQWLADLWNSTVLQLHNSSIFLV